MKNFIMAWRNLWRNRRRTTITVASVLFAVFFAILFRSLQIGSYDHMYKNAIESYSGYLQVQQKEWWDDKTVDNTFRWSAGLESMLLEDENVKGVVPRLESFMLASSGPSTKGVMVLGIDPQEEQKMSGIIDKKVKYRLTPEALERIRKDPAIPEKVSETASLFEGVSYTTDSRLLSDLGLDPEKDRGLLPILSGHAGFKNGDIRLGQPGVWMGNRLAAFMELGIGDTLVLVGQGYHGTTAAGIYEIKGIIQQPLPDIDNKIVYLPVDIAQQLFNAEGMLTSVALDLADKDDEAVRETSDRLNSLLPESTRMVTWFEMNEVMMQQMEADNKSGMIMIGILYLVIAFGVFGTVLMMTAERRREFGVLVAVGMQKKKLAAVISWEMVYIGLLGTLAGIVIGFIVISFGVDHPLVFKGEMAVMFEEYGFEPMIVFNPVDVYFLWQVFIVLLMVLISLVHPVRKILKLEVVNALRA